MREILYPSLHVHAVWRVNIISMQCMSACAGREEVYRTMQVCIIIIYNIICTVLKLFSWSTFSLPLVHALHLVAPIPISHSLAPIRPGCRCPGGVAWRPAHRWPAAAPRG